MSKRGGAAARRRKEARRSKLAEHRRVHTIKVARDFSRTPGGRDRASTQGEHSAEQFRDELLIPALKRCVDDEQVCVDLDGAAGYAGSFLEEVFGGAVRALGRNRCTSCLVFVSEEEPHLVSEIQGYMRDAGEMRTAQRLSSP